MARFTVFGAAGWIGAALVRHLNTVGHEVISVTRHQWPANDQNLGHAIYAIGLTADFRKRPLDTAEAHVGALVDVLRGSSFESFLYLSTTRIYKECSATSEDAAFTVRPSDPDHLYNLSKLAGESVCLSSRAPSLRVARLSNVIGAGDVSESFLPSVIREIQRTGRVSIRTACDSEKDYIALEDVMTAVQAISLSGKERIYNIASGENVSNMSLAKLLRQFTGAQVDFSPEAPIVKFPRIDVCRIRSEFGYKPTPFDKTLRRILDADLRTS